MAAGRRQDWALGLVRMQAPLRRAGAEDQHRVMGEEEKKLLAELGILGTAQRRVMTQGIEIPVGFLKLGSVRSG